MKPTRDYQLPPDREAYRRADHPRGRVIVIAPTRAACETIELALHTDIPTLLATRHGEELTRWAREGKGFGIVAGTGTGKTLGIRLIAEAILRQPLLVGVVNREREAGPGTAFCNVVVVTTGIARRWFTDDLITGRDTVVVDEIHQTSAELELCLALGKRAGCRFIWLSATVDPSVYREYLGSDEVLETSAFDPSRRARVEIVRAKPEQYLDDRTVRRLISRRRGAAVFLPTRAEVEKLGADLQARFPKLASAFYHGGEPIRVIRPFLEGEVEKPFLIAMTAAGQSALNLPGLDTVIIHDARYGNVVERGRNVLHRLNLGANEILQMAGRVHGRVVGGEVVILSERELDFASLAPGPPEFQLAGDAERVALTCAELGVDASELDLPVPLDRNAYRRAVRHLTARGIIENGRLTGYGRQVEELPVERPWAELLVHADRALVPLVAGASSIESLHRLTRDEHDLGGLIVSGSDHLTVYQVLAEAVDRCGYPGEVHGMPRHLFREQELAEWADRRGVLIKAIEDGALGLASVYRALDLPLPAKLPSASRELRGEFIDLVARIQPFELVLDERSVDGMEVRISRSSVAGSWGAVAGSIKFFADRTGTPRASIEGTTIPYDLVRTYAVHGPPKLVLAGHRLRQRLAVARQLEYFGFPLETTQERIEGVIPEHLREEARDLMARELIAGELQHPDRHRIARGLRELDEYWRRSGGALAVASPESRFEMIRGQLGDVDSWEELQQRPLALDVAALIPAAERAHLDALPDHLRILGDAVPVSYHVEDGIPVIRVVLREGRARRLREEDLPVFDREVRLVVHRDDTSIEAPTISRLRELLESVPRQTGDRNGRGRGRPGRGPRGGRPGGRGGQGGRGGRGGRRRR